MWIDNGDGTKTLAPATTQKPWYTQKQQFSQGCPDWIKVAINQEKADMIISLKGISRSLSQQQLRLKIQDLIKDLEALD